MFHRALLQDVTQRPLSDTQHHVLSHSLPGVGLFEPHIIAHIFTIHWAEGLVATNGTFGNEARFCGAEGVAAGVAVQCTSEGMFPHIPIIEWQCLLLLLIKKYLYPSIVSYSIFASGRAAAIFYTIVSVPAGARRQFFWLFLLCAGSESVENTNHPQPRAKLPDSGVSKCQVWAGCWRWRLGGLVPQQALCGYAAAAHASHTRCLGWLPTGFGAHHMRRRQREHVWCEFPQTVSKSITLSFNTNTYLNAEVRRNGKTECLWFWKWCARYRI